jgi:hypothetical protein
MPLEFGMPDQEVEDLLNEEMDRQRRQESSDYTAFYLPVGITRFRVLPRHTNSKIWFRELRKHRITTPDRGHTKLCPTMFGDECPVCTRSKELYDAKQMEAAKAFRPTTKYMVNAIILGTAAGKEFNPGKVYVLELPVKAFRSILAADRDPQGGWGDITGIASFAAGKGLCGVTYTITRAGQGLLTTYELSAHPQRPPLEDVLAAQNVNFQNLELADLSTVFSADSYEELTKLLSRAVFKEEGARPVAVPVSSLFNKEAAVGVSSANSAALPQTEPPRPQVETASANTPPKFSFGAPPPPPAG